MDQLSHLMNFLNFKLEFKRQSWFLCAQQSSIKSKYPTLERFLADKKYAQSSIQIYTLT